MQAMDLIHLINRMFNDSLRMTIFNNIKTNNPIIDAIFTTIILTSISYLLTCINTNNENIINDGLNLYNIKEYLKSFIYKKNTLIFEGKRSSTITFGNSMVSSIFTNRFNAVWTDIIKKINNNPSIFELKELASSFDSCKYIDSKDKEENIFIVSQKKYFIYNKDLEIYAKTEMSVEDINSNDERNKKNSQKMDKIVISLYSYKTPLHEMVKYIDDLTKQYIENVELSRSNKRYVYTLNKTKYEDCIQECWDEYEFDTTRKFSNIFFKEKEEVVEKINFFLENKQWYYDMGIPYSLGIGLHGPPGTGKTSFIKCLAEMTGRHIINISLKLIKTRTQLMQFFFESRYNTMNKKNSINFSKKIIVFEDIDCIGDIVLKRQITHDKNKNRSKKMDLSKLTTSSNVNVGEVLQTLIQQDDCNKISSVSLKPMEDDPITLDDILNLWDGLKETPGRIMVISSNHYDMLDPALVRPGRIDITLELSNASHEIICQMYKKYYKSDINLEKLKKIKNNFYSPAEIINLYVLHKYDPKKFIERLMQNKKI